MKRLLGGRSLEPVYVGSWGPSSILAQSVGGLEGKTGARGAHTFNGHSPVTRHGHYRE